MEFEGSEGESEEEWGISGWGIGKGFLRESDILAGLWRVLVGVGLGK